MRHGKRSLANKDVMLAKSPSISGAITNVFIAEFDINIYYPVFFFVGIML